MGFFSWRTQDTDRSICNNYSIRTPFHVDMIDDKGNVWSEDNYEGYGTFGGKDYYELLAEMNGLTGDGTEDLRMKGIELAFKPTGENVTEVKYPNLVESASGWVFDPLGPENCEYQGFFYDEDDDENDWDDTESEF